MSKIASAVLILLGTSVSVFAGGPPAPEIDPAAAPAALTLLGGALMVLRSRRRR